MSNIESEIKKIVDEIAEILETNPKTSSKEYLKVIVLRNEIAKKEHVLSMIEGNMDDPIVEAKRKFEDAKYEEGCYRWAEHVIEDAMSNSMLLLVPDEVKRYVEDTLSALGLPLGQIDSKASFRQVLREKRLTAVRRTMSTQLIFNETRNKETSKEANLTR